jgi:hypothetical protein
MNGTLMGRPAMHTVEAKWVLNHQFLEIHEWASPPALLSMCLRAYRWWLAHSCSWFSPRTF